MYDTDDIIERLDELIKKVRERIKCETKEEYIENLRNNNNRRRYYNNIHKRLLKRHFYNNYYR